MLLAEPFDLKNGSRELVISEIAFETPAELKNGNLLVDVAADHEAVVPFDVKTYPLDPIGNLTEPVASPTIKSPTAIIGDRALKAVTFVVCPVPPAVSGSVPVAKADVDVAYIAPPEEKDVNPVPPFVVARVPPTVTAPCVVVAGVSPVDPKLIDDTARDVTLAQLGAEAPLDLRTCPEVPLAIKVVVPVEL